jgi:ribosomal-protein-alanine N-acetyltransferase
LFDVLLFDTADNAAPLAALHAACFERGWDAATLSTMLAGPGTFAFCHNNGFVVVRTAADEAEILTLAVRPGARGKGLGRALLEAAIDKARALGAATMFLEVGADNPHALALYAGLGFAKVGARKAYYDGGDAAVLRLPLAGDFA